MEKIKLSICIPTRNRAGFIGEALESIISQAEDRVEIVILDGASTDNTQEVIQGYMGRFKNLVYSRQDFNSGIDKDMAKAIQLSRGEYCWSFSDDDVLKPGAINRILKEIGSGYEIYLCNITACNLFMQPYKEMSWLSGEVQDRVFNLHDKNELIKYCNKATSIGALFSYLSSIVMRRDMWIKSGYDDDFDKSAYALAATLFASIKEKCRLKYIKDSLVLWRNDNESFQHAGGFVNRFFLDFDGYLHLADKYLSFDPDVRASFLRVMQREHPWYTIIHAASHIDSLSLWAKFKAALLKFGYNPKIAQFCYLLGKHKKIVTSAVKIKRKIARSYWINKIIDWLCLAAKYSWKQILQITPLFNYLLVLNIFLGAFCVFRQPFEFYLGYVFILVFLSVYIYRYRSISVNANFLILLAIFTIASFINIHLGHDTVFFAAKQISGILLTGIAYYLLFKINNYDVKKLFNIYLRIALIIAAIGIFQELSYLIKFRMGYEYHWMPFIRKWESSTAQGIKLLRINSIFTEPSHFALSMAPAFLVSLVDIFKKNAQSLKLKWGSIVIIVSYLLTFSALAYLAVFISILLLPCRKKFLSLLVTLILIPIILFSAYRLLPDIRMRIDGAAAFIRSPHVSPDLHASIYSQVSNAFIAYNVFINNPYFGHGFGSHPLSYDKFMPSGVFKGFMQYNYPEVCKGDSGGLFLRLVSEAGLFGLIVVFYFGLKYYVRSDKDRDLLIISNGVLILFILQLLRQGHYFYNGLFFFVWIYYFAYKASNSKKLSKNH